MKGFHNFIGIASLLLFSTSLILKSLTIYSQILYVEVCSGLSKRIFNLYINQPYSWFLNRNSSELGKNIIAEVNTIVNYGLLLFS